MKYPFAIAALLLAAQWPVHAESSASVIACMQSSLPTTVRVEELQFTSSDKSGRTSTMQGRFFVTRDGTAQDNGFVRAMLQITAPAAYQGAAYLLREKSGDGDHEIFAYLPAVRRVRRISGAFADSTLFGTNFSYQDFRQLQTLFAPANSTFEGADKFGDRPASVISFQSSPNRVRMWVDQATCLPIKAEFIQGDIARKRFSAVPGALQKSSSGFWFISQFLFDDLIERSTTVVRMLGYKPIKVLPSRYFDPQMFYLAQ